MFSRPSLLALCLVLCACSVVGLYHLHAQPQARRQAQETDTEPHSIQSPSQPSQSDVTSDFYQTIIDNNLFAPLGTDLKPKPVPGANLSLVATFVSENALRSTAVIQNKATGRHAVLSIGGVIGDFTLMKIQPKQVTLDHHGKKPVVLRLPNFVFLNSQRSTGR